MPKPGVPNNPSGTNNHGPVTPQMSQSLQFGTFASRLANLQRSVTRKSSVTAPRGTDYLTQRAAELRSLANSAPLGFEDIASEFHRRASLMELGRDEVTAAHIAAGRHLEVS